jgi:hypothetical protein
MTDRVGWHDMTILLSHYFEFIFVLSEVCGCITSDTCNRFLVLFVLGDT